MMRKKSKRQRAKEDAYAGRTSLDKDELRDFRKDVLKHHIRVHYWLPRVKSLMRARGLDKIRYLSLPASAALDARLFRREGVIDQLQDKPKPFVYCEADKKNFEILRDTYGSSSQGFCGQLEDIATDSKNADYGNFWSSFPVDVINLDFWGDIHKVKNIDKSVFYAIQAIISHQSHLREPYELWITWRAKPDRVANNIENAYTELIQQNLKELPGFASKYDDDYSERDPLKLAIEDLVRIGFIKWILYVANKEFSVVDEKESEVLVYSRKDKTEKPYRLYNFLIRVKPYETIVIPSPACEAAKFCQQRHKASTGLCFVDPTDVDKRFRILAQSKKGFLRNSLETLVSEYQEARSGSLK